ncbi:MAG: YraN family protein [Candidatus Schekmanbacteria bacterium RBG_16_38_11]|uniref:UPF0102 protein A2042_08260 n=2 Tax=Candidatus Schekmaniibacteriota TaxID=1817811 RepID=A0A1F7RJF7_9BACT|nr:MAG: YraN family protein [Candidatus Schekmanbacteria bacterium GWA2_38_11]OGL45016.1 MAG: YraN family protein [Candidatus Schekmanbacteria bacterium RBG_16_38_11]
MEERREFGNKGEDLACKFLEKNGYKIIERNYRNRTGEIDIIARDKDDMVFIEIKTKLSKDFAQPELSVNPSKQKKIVKTALVYLMEKNINKTGCRFDVVGITGEKENTKIELIKNAFTTDGRYMY